MILLYFLSILVYSVIGEVADYGVLPDFKLTPLYLKEDKVLQLDNATFDDTIFGVESGQAGYLVEFYASWCGHCREFYPVYKNLGNDVYGWRNIVKIAAINCADPVNLDVCRTHGIFFYPVIKYFPRAAIDSTGGLPISVKNSVSEMREQLTKAVMDDYALHRYPDWPVFDFLNDVVSYNELWNTTALSASYIALIFEQSQASITGAQLLLDLSSNRQTLVARRALKSHPLVDKLKLTDFPTFAIFKKESKEPVFVAEVRRLLFREIETFLGKPYYHFTDVNRNNQKKNFTDCFKFPELCKPNYFVSEVDLLKASRYALFRETARKSAPLRTANLSALYEFTSLLADNFPTTTIDGAENDTLVHLDRSSRAVRVFSRLRDFLADHGLDNELSIADWQKAFVDAETEAGNPFPLNTPWDHCAGSSHEFRGYTCGLWTTFHTLTVNAYRNYVTNMTNVTLPLPPLQAIRDWVGSFFGCDTCRNHFLKMTTDTFKLEANVRDPEDVFMYLWKAHNRVNARLHGQKTEDPKFPKYQFPPKFLCEDCNNKGALNETATEEFLLDYYSRVKPFHQPTPGPI
ncbi:unnamed protein product [Caenorhabditis angaria]|uniref:Sulfhydryl oxidase n=1 Tax=Caenorhabditis angaria TaxID=860376 RepID=A0A9P1N8Y1_9PELO|nr:unnamed protein product [Caenorhabditis angaria]